MKKYQEILDEARSGGITKIEDVMEEAIKNKDREAYNAIFNGVADGYQDGIISSDRYTNFINKYSYKFKDMK